MRRGNQIALVAVSVVAGCGQILIPDLNAYQVHEDEPTAASGGTTVSATTSSSSSTSSPSSSSVSSSGAGGAGGEMSGMGGMGSMNGGMGGAGGMIMSTAGSGGSGGAPVCDNPEVVDKIDPSMRCKISVPTDVSTVVTAPASAVWADIVVDFSSEFSMANWGAIQAKGPPDVYPISADKAWAWAQMMTDQPNEFIKVGYTNPVIAESVWVYETFNPGAISKITITAMDGDHIVYQNPSPHAIGACSHVLSVSTMTCSPISAVRVDVASDKVPGYNEIDAIGLIPAD